MGKVEGYPLAKSALAGKSEAKKPSKKVVKEIRHRKAGKGFIVEHHHSSDHPMEEMTMPDKAALMDHIDSMHPEDEAAEGNQPATEEQGE